MGIRLRIGPFSASSRGRVGVNVGPVGVYGGGRRRRSTGGGGGLAVFGVLVLIALVVTYWYIAVPLVVIVGVVAIFALRADARRAHERAEHQAQLQREHEQRQQALDRAREREREANHRAWLAGPPPPLAMPGRFTPNWLAANAPHLHPGQVPMLLKELRARGWTDGRINDRVRPYLPSSQPAGGGPSSAALQAYARATER